MGIGASIFLIAAGLILALATSFNVAGLDVHVIGWILVAVGVLGLVMTMAVWGPRRRTVARADVVATPPVYDDRI